MVDLDVFFMTLYFLINMNLYYIVVSLLSSNASKYFDIKINSFFKLTGCIVYSENRQSFDELLFSISVVFFIRYQLITEQIIHLFHILPFLIMYEILPC